MMYVIGGLQDVMYVIGGLQDVWLHVILSTVIIRVACNC